MSVQYPQKEGIGAIKLDENHWEPITGQVQQPSAGNPTADNYAPGGFTGGTQPRAVGEPISNYAPAQTTSPSKAAYRTVTGANIQP